MAKISSNLDALIRERAANGHSSEAIAAWLKSEHGVSVSSRALRGRLQAARKERSEVTRAVVQEKLAKTVLTDIDRLDRIRKQVAKKARHLIDDDDKTREWTALKKLESDIIDRKLHYAGADAPNENAELTSAAERVRRRLASLADRRPA